MSMFNEGIPAIDPDEEENNKKWISNSEIRKFYRQKDFEKQIETELKRTFSRVYDNPDFEFYCTNCCTGISEPLPKYDFVRDEKYLACTICELPVTIAKAKKESDSSV